MGTIFIALALYTVFVICVFIVRFILWILDGLKAENAKVKAKQAARESMTSVVYSAIPEEKPEESTRVIEHKPAPIQSAAALEALREQRRIIEEQISDINEMLDFCPPEKTRNQYLNRKTILLGKLATCENKISRLCA